MEGRLVGVLALFARKFLGQDTLEALELVADILAQGIERKKRAEEKLALLNRTLQTLCNATKLSFVLPRNMSCCARLQHPCRCRRPSDGVGWLPRNERGKDSSPSGSSRIRSRLPRSIDITWAETEGTRTDGRRDRTSETSWTMDILADPNMALWQAEALERRYASSIALPLLSHGEAFRALALYAGETDAFTQSTIEQYTDLANNLAYGVMALRTRDERKKGGKRNSSAQRFA